MAVIEEEDIQMMAMGERGDAEEIEYFRILGEIKNNIIRKKFI